MTLRALIRPLLRDPLRQATERRGGWTPAGLFAAGEQGGWWDPSDFSTMFQDSAGTTPVTATGQPVGKILDKSGRGNHRTQPTAGSRPVLTQDASGFFYLAYDGVDDFMLTASVDFSATNKMTCVVGFNKQSDAAVSSIIELGASGATVAGTMALYGAATAGFTSRLFASVASNDKAVTSAAAPVAAVISQALDASQGTAALQNVVRLNGVATGTAGSLSTAANFASNPIYYGRRGGTTLPFNGREYQTILRGAASTAAQIALAERFVGSRMGIAL